MNAEPKTRRRRHLRRAAGIQMPAGVDGRSPAARKFRSLVKDYARTLGDPHPSPADAALVRQCAGFARALGAMEERIAAGELVDHDVMIRLSSELRRLTAELRARAEEIEDAGTKAGRRPAHQATVRA